MRKNFFWIFLFLITSNLFVGNTYAQDTTWYTLASGSWDDPTIWTLDPSGSLPNNPDNLTPTTAVTGNTHKVVILSGRTIDVYSDTKTNASLKVTGRIDFHATTGHTFTEIRGGGKIILKEDNFPAGDASHFITGGQGEGTVIFDSTGYDLTTAHTFYNVEIDLDNTTDVAVLLADYQINGNLVLTQGVLQINDNSSTTLLDLDVDGNVNVSDNSSISVGTANAYDGGQNYYNRFHDFTVGGDFVSYGKVRFTNQTVPDYSAQTTTGAVTLHFTGAADNYFKLYDTTDLYNLHVDKGTDATYELSVYAHDKAYFALFAPNNSSYDRFQPHPQHDKAFWIEAGTIRLKGEIVIPSLGEGGNDWTIGENAALVLDGENVEAYSTGRTSPTYSWTGFSHAEPNNISDGTGSQGIYVYGDLIVENGYFSTQNSAGLVYRDEAPGMVNISGGEVSIAQLRLTGTASSGYYSYIQSGGVFRVRGNGEESNSYAIFSLDEAEMYFSMSGGQLIIEDYTSYSVGAIEILCDEGNYNITGGEVVCDWGATSEVYSTADLYNFSITNGTTVDMAYTLTVSNDLSIDATSELDAGGNDLYIQRDLLFADGATFTHGNNTTYFYGGDNSDIDIDNTTDIPALTFYNLIIGKDQQSDPNLFWDLGIDNCAGRSQAVDDEIITVANGLTITRGQFTTARYTVSLLGDLSITDGKLVYDAALPGRLMLEGSAQQTLTGSEIYSPEFGHIDLDNANGATIASNVDLDLFTLTQGIMDINEFKFSLDTNEVVDGSGGGFSATKMIMTQGLAGDRGLEFGFNLTASTSTGTIATFPVGVSGKYTPIEVDLENTLGASYSGTFRVLPIDDDHPALRNGWSPNRALNYYWKSYVTGSLEDIATADITVTFYNQYDTFYGNEYYLLGNDWNVQDNNPSNPLVLEEIGFLESDYTVAKNGEFNISWVFYSYQDGDWTDYDTWSRTGHDVYDPPTDYPKYLDVVYIGGTAADNHTVTIDGNGREAAKLTIYSGDESVSGEPTLDALTYTGHTFNDISGGGRFRLSYNGDIPSGNWDNFMYNDTAIFEYYGGAYTIPTDFTVYPNLEITGSGTTKTMPNQDVLVRKNMLIDTETVLLGDGDDLYISDSLIIDNAGEMQFPTNADPCVLTVGESVDLSRNSAANTIEIVTGGSNTGNHSLYVFEDIILNANSVIDLYDASDNAVDLYFDGDSDSEVNDAGGASIDLNRLIIDKSVSTADVDFLEGFTLNGPTNGTSAEKALYLLNGDLTINNSGTDIYLTSGGGDFKVPSTASLNASNATLRASGTNTGIYLDGLMQVGNGSQWLLNEGTNNYIEYSASGNAEISIYQGTLRVGSQIRRNTITEEGILTFSQNHSNSTVTIGETDAPENRRGVFEVLNSGSSFTQVADANITIVQAQSTPATASLYLDPASSSIGSGATFTFGNASTPASQDMGIYSTVNLQNVTLDNASGNNPTVTEWIVDLTVNEDLTIGTGTEFDANGLDLTINGDFLNYGTFTHNNNSTYFSGSGNQRIYGNTTFYDLTKTSSGEMWLAASNAAIVVSNDLDFQDGTLRDSSNTVTLLGDVNFDGTHIHGAQSGDGFYFNGTDEQQFTGSGTFGKISVENSSGITMPVGNNITVVDTLKLIDGVFGIGKNLLTLNVDCEIEEANPFSSTNMIQTNVSFTDYGVRKYFPSGAINFEYPIGAGGKYTPVTLDITENTSSTGYITVKAGDEMHPSIQEDSETPSIVDEDNVLQYHWVMNSSGITGFRATAYMTYIPGDVEVTAPYDVYDYITARLLNDGSGLWNKYTDVDKFDEVNEWCVFDFGLISPVDDEQISGDYTAGIDDAIPDEVPFYESNADGTWPTSTIWTPNITGGPNGAMVLINTPDTVTTPSNFVSSYTTEIQGTVSLGTTFGHRFGTVNGTGLIYSEREVIPAGVYDDFFSSAGGTLEFGGSTDYDVLGGHATVNNLTFSGTGERRLPSNNVTLNGDLTLNGGAALDVIVDEGYDIDIKGDLSRVSGSFDAGTNLANTVSFTSAVSQTISGYFTGSNTLNTMEVDNPNGISISSGTVDIAGTLNLTNGTVTTSATDTLRIGVTSTISPASGSASAYINGPLTKVMSSGDDFIFPIGKSGGGLGIIEITNITGITGVDTDVSIEYFFSSPDAVGDVTQTGSGVNTVSESEYWSVDVVGGGQSTIDITLDGSSDVANALSDINDLIIVGWSGTQWEQLGGTYTITGTATSGSIACNSDIDYSSYQYITLASSVAITLITGTILSADYSICSGDAASITLAFTGGTAPWTYTLNGTDYAAASSPHVHNITPAPTVTTVYTLTAVSDVTPTAGSIVGNSDVTVTVNPIPTPTLSPSPGSTICAGENVIFSAGTGSNYDFYLNAGLVQSGTASTYNNSGLSNGDEVDVIVTSSGGCSSALGTVPVTMTVLAVPTPVISGADTSCEGNTDTYTSAATGNTFTWSITTHGSLQSAQGTETMDILWTTLTPGGTLQSTETVTVEEDNGTCTADDTFDVVVFSLPKTGPQYHINNAW